MTATVLYEGELHTSATHLQSGTVIGTDAPVDNGGKGALFSPTDLVAVALASCMCTVMGLSAAAHGITIGKIKCEVDKIMLQNPRRIGEIKITMMINGHASYTDHARSVLERAALTCPVLESLHPECKKNVLFIWA